MPAPQQFFVPLDLLLQVVRIVRVNGEHDMARRLTASPPPVLMRIVALITEGTRSALLSHALLECGGEGGKSRSAQAQILESASPATSAQAYRSPRHQFPSTAPLPHP